ncbi:MAG: DNA polymerase III subunit beta [Bacteroidales bacterium]|nr:DNA polymerase III subunit beta [Bacteroidales bacterium]
MKFKVLSSDLLSHLSAISRVLSNKTAMPILENFLFELQPEALVVTASDGDTTMITRIAISEVTGNGRFAVPSKTLLDLLREMPQQEISFEIDDENLEIFVNYENGKYNFIATNAAEYPKKKDLAENAQTLEIPEQVLLGGITSTIFATSDDELRPVMNGIFLDIKPDHVIFVASDSQKLVRLENKAVQPGFESSFILPKKPANLLKGIIGKDMEGNAKVSFDANNAQFQIEDYTIICRLVEGRFPRYESVIPKNNTNIMTIDRQTFINVLRRVSVFSNSATNQVKLEIDNNSMTVSAQDIDFSISAVEKAPCSYNSEPIQIGFRANFLIEILNTINSPEIDLKLSDQFRAGLIVPVANNENEDLLMLVMPMKLLDF